MCMCVFVYMSECVCVLVDYINIVTHPLHHSMLTNAHSVVVFHSRSLVLSP